MSSYNVTACAIVVAIHLGLCIITTALRCYTRRVLLKNFWADDWLSVLSLFFYTGLVSFYLHGIAQGTIGHHIASIKNPLTIESGLMELFFIGQIYAIGTCVIKISFAITLLRLLQKRVHLYILYFTVFIVISETIICSLAEAFLCHPIDYSWKAAVDPYNFLLAEGKDPAALGIKPLGACRGIAAFSVLGYIQIVVVLVVDIVLGIVLPILLLKDLKMRRGLKISSGAILALGTIASAASVFRFPYTRAITAGDVFFNAQPLFFWTIIEYSWCQIGTSCVTLKPLLVRMNLIRDNSLKALESEAKSEKAPSYFSRKLSNKSANSSRSTSSWEQNLKINVKNDVETAWRPVPVPKDSPKFDHSFEPRAL